MMLAVDVIAAVLVVGTLVVLVLATITSKRERQALAAACATEPSATVLSRLSAGGRGVSTGRHRHHERSTAPPTVRADGHPPGPPHLLPGIPPASPPACLACLAVTAVRRSPASCLACQDAELVEPHVDAGGTA